MDEDQEFLEAQQMLNQLIDGGKLSNKMSQKLQLIQLSVYKEANVDTSVFDQLSASECDQLLRLNQVAKKQMFIMIISELANNSTLLPPPVEVINGDIEIKTKMLGRWKKKKFILSIVARTFEIPRKVKKGKQSKKQERVIQLEFYLLTPVKMKEGRHRFRLEATVKNKGYYKTLDCGTHDLSLYTSVLEQMKKLCKITTDSNLTVSTDQMMQGRGSEIYKAPILQGPQRMTQSLAPGSKSIIMQEQNDRMLQSQPPKQDTSIKAEQPSPQQEIIIEEHSIIIKQNPDQQFDLNDVQQESPPSIKFSNHISNQIQIEPLQKITQERACSPPQQKENEQKQNQSEMTPPKDTERDLIIQAYSEEKNPDEPQQVEQPKDFKSQIEKLQSEQHEEEFYDFVEDDRVPQYFAKLSESGKFSHEYLDTELLQTVTVYQANNVEIQRSTLNPLLFRAYIKLENTDLFRVFQAFAEIEFCKKWNGNINTNESKYVQLLTNERQAFTYEKRKQYGLFYLPRDYVYLRYVFEQQGDLFIVDRSIQHEDCPSQRKVIRGEINYQVIRISSSGDQVNVTFETETTNGGFSSTEQDGAITLVYLTELKNIQEFLKTYSSQTIIESPLLNAIQNHMNQKKKRISAPQSQSDQKSMETPNQDISFDQVKSGSQMEEFKPQLSLDEQIEQLETIQRKLSFLPDMGTYKPEQQKPQNPNDFNEVTKYDQLQQNDEQVELDQADYVPAQVMMSTGQTIPPEYRERVMKQIKAVEQESYFGNCLNQKYPQEPTEQKKNEFMTNYEGAHFFLKKDWERDTKNGGLLFINPKKVEAQKRVIKFMLKKIGSNLITGKSILSISLPVEIFETRSNLERFAYAFTYAPKFLEEAAKMSTPEEQMKMSVTFGLSAIVMYLSLEKPFNPILGETYQGFIDGCPVYVEQITHHPPICAFQLYGRGYRLDGHIESVASMHANSVQGKNVGYLRMTYYNTKAVQLYMMVPGLLQGTAFGDRCFNLSGKGYCVDVENSIIWEGIFNPPKSSMFGRKETPQDAFIGGVYKVKQSALTKFKKEGYSKFSGLDMTKDVYDKLNNVVGVWNEYIEIDGIQTWNLKISPHILTNNQNPLPSDSFYRLDILHWKLLDFDNAQRSKELLEVKQRADKKLREKAGPKKH